MATIESVGASRKMLTQAGCEKNYPAWFLGKRKSLSRNMLGEQCSRL
ncbi:hypothetical protein PGS49_22810 [Yersinia intermedia]|nr:hypothetical protein [Yersinia intermedia]MDA5483429.1 hypothetical protein [Yersinia intermedia]